MADLVRQHPAVHLTVNLTPALLWQIDDYLKNGATDRALELTLKPAEEFSADDREYVLSNFFDAHWHNQIFPHPRYKELFEQRYNGKRFSEQDIRDLQMWFNLAWFAKEFRERDVSLVTGEVVSVRRFVHKAHDFDVQDIRQLVECEYKVLGAIIPLHRRMQDDGQIEISTTPFFHPILPLLMDTDSATIDRPGAKLPSRFSWPEDAETQVKLAIEAYTSWFGRPPRGMWPAEGAVSQSIIPLFARNGIRWIASDEGVLGRSGQYGYSVEDPNVLCRPYRAQEREHQISIFFRSRNLSDAIGFDYHAYADHGEAATDFLNRIRHQFVDRTRDDSDSILTVILDGENAWGDYRDDARPFLTALYSLLETAGDIQCVTPSEYLALHAAGDHPQVFDLFTGSWIDRWGSRPGVDLDTWIGEEEKNKAWELLGQARRDLGNIHPNGTKRLRALHSIYTAEGSDWFWWLGSDHESGHNERFDDLFRGHLKHAYSVLGRPVPAVLNRHIAPHTVIWTFANQIEHVQPRDRITIQTNCPGVLTWRLDDLPGTKQSLTAAGGAMSAVQYYHWTLGPFPPASRQLAFSFRCTHEHCSCSEICCEERLFVVEISGADASPLKQDESKAAAGGKS
jgi:alpha-amylase/alpha-mannosidase (GH57 family)